VAARASGRGRGGARTVLGLIAFLHTAASQVAGFDELMAAAALSTTPVPRTGETTPDVSSPAPARQHAVAPGCYVAPVILLVALVLAFASAADAVVSTPLAGTSLAIRSRDGARGRIAFVAKDRALALDDDSPLCGDEAPPSVPKAFLRVFGLDTAHDTGSMRLPCGRWRRLGNDGFGYKDRRREDGPCTRVVVRPGKRVAAACGRAAYTLEDGVAEERVAVTLGIGPRRFCSVFAAKRDGGDGRRFKAGRADAPDACPLPGLPPDVRAASSGWPMANRDLAGTRAATDSPITSATVAGLVEAWRAPMPGVGTSGSLATNPLIAGDTVFVQDLRSNVVALDLESGVERWRHDALSLVVGPNGPALGYGMIFAVEGRAEVVARDAANGAERWRVEMPVATDTEGLDIQPVVYDGRLLLSTVPISLFGQFRGGDRGVLHALDVDDGAILWSFDTVDSPDLWGNPTVNSGGGAWFPPAVDAVSGLVYWGIGNAAPFPGTAEFPNGSSRPGPNLYTNSVLALDADSGALQWFDQALPRDLLDHDLQLVLLADAGDRRIVIATGKMGIVYAYDAATGERLWQTPIGAHENDDLPAYPLGVPTLVKPGLLGGVMTPPAVAGGTLYVAINDMATPYQGDRHDPFSFMPYLDAATTEVVALDLATGALEWSRRLPEGAGFGAATVVGDLVFTSTYDGTIHALDRATGATAWSTHAGGGINGWPAVSGDTIVFPVGVGPEPAVVAYRLAG